MALASDHTLITAIPGWLTTHQSFAAVLVFVLGFAESIVLIAILVPSSVLLAGIGASYAASGGSLEILWLAGALGAAAGDAASFGMGHYLRDDAARTWPFRRYPELARRGRKVFERWGWFALVISKFAFGVRPFVALTAGIVAMPLMNFLVASLISSVLWAGAALGFGYAATVALQAFFA